LKKKRPEKICGVEAGRKVRAVILSRYFGHLNSVKNWGQGGEGASEGAIKGKSAGESDWNQTGGGGSSTV